MKINNFKFRNLSNLITCNYQGRLGNLMYEIAATLAAAWDNGLTPSFPQQHHRYYDDIPAFKEYLLPIVSQFHRHNRMQGFKVYNEPASYEYKPIVADGDTILKGFFTDSRFFDNYRQRIIDLYKTHSHQVQTIYQQEIVALHGSKKYVSIHVRRQDYVTDYHADLPLEYYKEALIKFDADDVFVIFSDDLPWCLENFSFLQNVLYVHKQDYIELQLMGLMDAHIMSNSTFSAWGVILGDPLKQKTVYAPANWWPTHHNKGIYEEHWIKL